MHPIFVRDAKATRHAAGPESRKGTAAAKPHPGGKASPTGIADGCFGDPDWPGTTFWSTIGP